MPRCSLRAAVAMAATPATAADRRSTAVNAIPAAYDDLIREAAGRYLPEWSWLWLKAQLYQESLLVPTAQSPVGARGIAQFMPGTWAQMIRELKMPANASPETPELAIPAAAYYMAKLRRVWYRDRTEDDRRRLAQASYNAGSGRLIEAQRLARNVNDYASIAAMLPSVPGFNGWKETTDYVVHIEHWYAQLLAEAPNQPQVP